MSTTTGRAGGHTAIKPAGGQPVQRRRRSVAAWRAGGGLAAIIFALPVLIVFGYFAWTPIVRGVVMSFQSNNFVTGAQWVGWGNFTYVLKDPLLTTAVLNTLWFTVLALVFGFPVPLFLAVFIGELRRKGLYSVLAYLPVVVPPVASILLWKTIYDPSPTGVFNSILGVVGLGPFAWLNSPAAAMPSIVLEATWAGAGGTMVIYLAALGSMRSDLYEAAELDGANIPRRIWHITLPQLRGVILTLLLLQVIGTMQIFTEPYIFTGGGPNNATITVLLLIYRYAFVDVDYGAAAALSILLAVVLAVISVIYQLVTRKWSHQ